MPMAVTGAYTSAASAEPAVAPVGRAVGEARSRPGGAPPVPPAPTNGGGGSGADSRKYPTRTVAAAMRRLAVAAHATHGETADAPQPAGPTRT